jgi:DNA polymerase III epsilon subunit-like protein
MSEKLPKGYMTRLLVIDTETSGLVFNTLDPSYDPKTKTHYQALSIGLIVVDAQTLDAIEELYLEMKWDGESAWSQQAQKTHGLSIDYLEENGLDVEDAVAEIGNLILEHWGPTTAICLAGHNPGFDKCFLDRMMKSQGIELRFGNRMVDTHSVGFTVFGTYSSDELFEMVGMETRSKHNALDDARSSLQVLKMTRGLSNECFGG